MYRKQLIATFPSVTQHLLHLAKFRPAFSRLFNGREDVVWGYRFLLKPSAATPSPPSASSSPPSRASAAAAATAPVCLFPCLVLRLRSIVDEERVERKRIW